MTTKRKVEVFSAGCPLCEEAVSIVQSLACPACDVSILDVNESVVVARAKGLGVARVTAVAVDDQIVDCCRSGGFDEKALRAAGVGDPA